MKHYFIVAILTAILSCVAVGSLSGCRMFFRPKPVVVAPVGDNLSPVIKIVEKMNWWIPLLIFGGVGGGVFSFIMGPRRLGLQIVAGTLVTVTIAVGVMQFMWQFALIGGIAGLLLMGYVVYVNRKAFVLTVEGIEKYKKKHPEAKDELVETLIETHGENADVKGLIAQSKAGIRKRAKKVADKVKSMID